MPIIVETDGPSEVGPAPGVPILTIIQQACTVLALQVPDQIYGSTLREHVELGALATEMAQRIAFDTKDWASLTALATFTGDGVTEESDMPFDYRRMLKTTELRKPAQIGGAMRHVSDLDQWLQEDIDNFNTYPFGSWTLYNAQIHFRPVLALNEVVKFFYLSKLAIVGASYEMFTADTDTFLLDWRTLKLGIIWQWKANKGIPYGEDLENYQTALDSFAGPEKGPGIIKTGPARWPGNAMPAYPRPLGA